MPLRVLLADDNECLRLLLRQLMLRTGCDFEIAENGQQAVDLYRAAAESGNAMNLVVLDAQMPQVDGVEAARQIRAFEVERGLKACHLAFFTAYFDDAVADVRGMADCGVWVKPDAIVNLQERIATALEQ